MIHILTLQFLIFIIKSYIKYIEQNKWKIIQSKIQDCFESYFKTMFSMLPIEWKLESNES